MKHIIESPPRTMMEVFKMLPEGTLAELIDNQLYMAPFPDFEHQNLIQDINYQLYQAVKLQSRGVVIHAPFDVFLDEQENAVQPDLIVVLNDNLHIISKGKIHGIPDLCIEVLSAGNKKHDLITKKALYEKFGVKEYWIVDPQTKLALGYQLNDQAYKLIAEDIGLIRSPLLSITINF